MGGGRSLIFPVHYVLLPNHQRWHAEWKLSLGIRTRCTHVSARLALRFALHAQPVRVSKIYASELSWKFTKSALLVGLGSLTIFLLYNFILKPLNYSLSLSLHSHSILSPPPEPQMLLMSEKISQICARNSTRACLARGRNSVNRLFGQKLKNQALQFGRQSHTRLEGKTDSGLLWMSGYPRFAVYVPHALFTVGMMYKAPPSNKPNQQRNLNKLSTELWCINFVGIAPTEAYKSSTVYSVQQKGMCTFKFRVSF